jgi:hypothetical protein
MGFNMNEVTIYIFRARLIIMPLIYLKEKGRIEKIWKYS